MHTSTLCLWTSKSTIHLHIIILSVLIWMFKEFAAFSIRVVFNTAVPENYSRLLYLPWLLIVASNLTNETW